MSDQDKTLRLMIDLGVVGQKDAQAVNELLLESKQGVEGMTQTLPEGAAAWEKYKDVLNDASGALDHHGHMMNSNRLYAELFRRSLMSVGEYIPGLEFAVYGLGTAMGTLTGGVILGGVAIEQYVKKYKENIEQAVKAVEEANQRIIDSNKKVIDSIKGLDEALHPVKTTAQQDERDLSHKIDQLKEQAAQQKEILKAQEDQELASATSEEQKAAIKDKYKQMDRNVDMLTQSQTAGLQSAAAENAQKQIQALDKQIADRKAQVDADNAKQQAEADQFAAQYKAYTAADDPTGGRRKELATRIADIEAAIAGRNDRFAAWAEATKKGAGDLGNFADNTQSNADASAEQSTRQRQTFGTVGRTEATTEQINTVMDAQNAHHETLRELLKATNKSHETSTRIVQQIIAKHLDYQKEMEFLESQLSYLRSHQGN